MPEINWTRKAPPEIRILGYMYANGGTVTHTKGVGSYICREIDMDSASLTKASQKLEAEGVLYRSPRAVRGHHTVYNKFELAGDWEKYEPAIKKYLGIDEVDYTEAGLPMLGMDVTEEEVFNSRNQPKYVDSRIIESELEKDNQISTALQMFQDSDWENRKLRRILEHVLPLVNASKVIELLLEDADAEETD